MRLTSTLLLASGALAAGINRRTLETAQNCLANIQSAEEAMDTALKVPLNLLSPCLPSCFLIILTNNQQGLKVDSSEGADALSQSMQGASDAISQAVTTMASVQPLSAAEAQTFLSSVESMTSSLKLASMSLVLQQPAINSLGLTNAAVQSLTVQRQQLTTLTQSVVTLVSTEVVPVIQVGLGQAVSAIDLGLGMLNGEGKVVVEMGEADLNQQCADAGFVAADQCQQDQAAADQNLEQQCMDAGLVKEGEQAGAGKDEQDAVEQCAAIGFVEDPAAAGDAGQEEAQEGEAEAHPAEGEAAQAHRLRRTEAAQPAAEQAPAEEAPAAEAAAGEDAAQDDLVQQCAGIGFVEQAQEQEQFEASPEACAALGLVEQAKDGEEENQDVAQQCMALGLQPAEGQEAAGEEKAGEDAAAEGEQAGAEQMMRRAWRVKPRAASQDEAAQQQDQEAAGKEGEEAAAAEEQQAEQEQAEGQISVEECKAMGFVEADAAQETAAQETEAAAQETAAEEGAAQETAAAEQPAEAAQMRRRAAHGWIA